MSSDGPYFAAPTETPAEPGRFVRLDDLVSVEMVPGLTLRALTGTKLMASFARYEPGVEAPLHAHVEEQIFVALEGEFEVEIDGEVRTLRPGEAAHFPSWVGHRVKAGPAGGYQLDIFSPPREGLLTAIATQAG